MVTGALTVILIAAFAFLLSMPALSLRPPERTEGRAVVDERGITVSLPETVAKQAVFMAIGAGEYVLVTRQPERVVTSTTSANTRLTRLTLLRRAMPAIEMLRMPMSEAETGSIGVETLLLERPDVIVTWGRLADRFEAAGLTTIGLGPVSSSERHVRNTEIFGAVVGEERRASQMTARYRRRREVLASEIARTVKLETSFAVLNISGNGTFRAGSILADLAGDAHGLNVRTSTTRGVINSEDLLSLAPGVILITGGGGLDHAASERFMSDRKFQSLPAVRNRRVHTVPPGISGFMNNVVDLPIFMRWLAEVLHPGALEGDIKAYARQIYNEELGVEPTDAELDEALAISDNSGFPPPNR